jgi:hypothetical protein
MRNFHIKAKLVCPEYDFILPAESIDDARTESYIYIEESIHYGFDYEVNFLDIEEQGEAE